jgi:EAL domain-containing protein (putative c-di-GMP-specific phosphodiesterase class I)/GGDEF domain-containing protein
MTTKNLEESLERFRHEALKLRSVLHDRTTRLPAFPVLFDRLRAFLHDRRRVGVVHVEIANLDLVESLYGWQVFDRILARVSGILKDSIGDRLPTSTLLAINGIAGDRFVAFLPEAERGGEVTSEFLDRVGAGIGVALETAFDNRDFAGLTPKLSFRTGHAFLSEDPFYRFERRVYSALEEARTYSERAEQRRDRSWGADLKQIIRNSEVSTVFQPVVDLETGDLLGYEALSRGPKDSFFEMPRAMFALSSRVGVDVDLDRLCRNTALRELGRLSECGKVFVNVLPGSLDDPAWLSGEVTRCLEEASLSPADLVIEVSERGADLDSDRFADSLVRLKREGFALALDDVGTGYSTLATLEKVRPDYLKVDSQLVQGIHENLIKQEVLASIVQISRQVGASVIAKGVESKDDARALRAAGARYGQGFFYAEPSSPGSAVHFRSPEAADH